CSSFLLLEVKCREAAARCYRNAPGLPPTGDPRTPDIVVQPRTGVIYTGSTNKQEEHGGFAHDDTNVMMVVSNPRFAARTVTSFVETTQAAPTILKVLGLDPRSLDAVRIEGTPVPPGPRSRPVVASAAAARVAQGCAGPGRPGPARGCVRRPARALSRCRR